MGSADIVPGVSGGTVALVLGIYDRLITNISLGARGLKQLLTGDFSTFRETLTEIEWAHPDDAATAVAVDLGAAGPSAPRAAAGVIAELIARARQVALEAVDGPEVVVADVLAVGRVTELLTAAHTKVTGGAW